MLGPCESDGYMQYPISEVLRFIPGNRSNHQLLPLDLDVVTLLIDVSLELELLDKLCGVQSWSAQIGSR